MITHLLRARILSVEVRAEVAQPGYDIVDASYKRRAAVNSFMSLRGLRNRELRWAAAKRS